MVPEADLEIARKVIHMRLVQMMINERYKNNEFRIPIHLAFGHESIAVAINEVMTKDDRIILSHRNVHYNISRGATLKSLLDEYCLRPEGLSGGKEGSMNLTNPEKGVVYTSSILGNNLGVGAGVALAIKAREDNGVVIIVTGDGAMEEGSFYETLLFFSAQSLSGLIIVENNEWSLGSKIEERRSNIHVQALAESTGAEYVCLTGNNVFNYIKIMKTLRNQSESEKKAIVVEVMLSTLGDWRLITDEYPNGKYINYHAGPAKTVELKDWPIIKQNECDPLAILSTLISIEILIPIALEIKAHLMEGI